VDRSDSEKGPRTGIFQTDVAALVFVKCGKFLDYFNENILKAGAEGNIWAKDGCNKVKLKTISH
jgi:hypothetical protein